MAGLPPEVDIFRNACRSLNGMFVLGLVEPVIGTCTTENSVIRFYPRIKITSPSMSVLDEQNILADIKDEKNAIDDYLKHAEQTDRKDLKQLLLRIRSDEALHEELLEDARKVVRVVVKEPIEEEIATKPYKWRMTGT